MNKKSTFLIVLVIIISSFIVFKWIASTGPEKPEVEENVGPVHLRLQSFALALNPLKMADVESRQVATLLYAGLIIQNQDGLTQSAAAQTWKHTGNIWEFKLKPELTFSNGNPLRTQDVATSICNAMQPTSPWAWALASIEHEISAEGKNVECTGIEIVSNSVIRITEARPVPWFLDAIGGPAGWILPAEKAEEGAYGVMPGLGPYTIEEFIPDNRVVMKPRSSGSAIKPGTNGIQFDYIADDAVAAGAFKVGKLHVLDLTSPNLVESLLDVKTGGLNTAGELVQLNWDRIRIAIINEKHLSAKGFDDKQVRQFIQSYSAAINRKKIAETSLGIAVPLTTSFPPVSREVPTVSESIGEIPAINLTVITEPDAYSDLIAASLPTNVGNVTIDYRGVDKGVLIQSLISGDFDIASILIEATTHSPEFWKSFFTPGNPFTAFGKPIAGLENVEVYDEVGIQRAADLIEQNGNWVGILQEKRFQAIAPGITGISYSPSGQTNYATIKQQ